MRRMELQLGSGEKICVNPGKIAYVKSLDEEGCYLYFDGGESVPVRDLYETVINMIPYRD